MATSVGSLVTNVVADTTDFQSNLKRAQSTLDGFGARMNKMMSQVDKGFAGLGGTIKKFGGDIFSINGAITAAIGTVGGGGLILMAKAALDAVGGLGEMAQQLGVTTTTLQAFRYAGTQVGVSNEEMDAGLAKLTKTIGSAADGNKSAIDTFRDLGIHVLDASGNVRSTDDVIYDLANSIKGIPDPARRAAALVDTMGKAGQKLAPLMEGGAAGIDELVRSAKDLGLIFDEETIKNADEASDKLATMSEVIRIKLTAALVKAAPLFDAFADKVIELITALNDMWDASQPGGRQSLTGLQKELENTEHYIDVLTKKSEDMKKSSTGTWLLGDTDKLIADAQKTADTLRDKIDAAMLAAPEGDTADETLKPKKGGTDPKDREQALKDAAAAAKAIADLQFQMEQLSRSGVDQAVADALKGFKGTPEQAAQVRDLTAAAYDQAEAQREMNEELQAEKSLMQEGAAVTQSALTPLQKYAETVANLDKLLEGKAIEQGTYNQALLDANKILEDADPLTKSLRDSAADLGDTIGTAFEDAVLEGKNLQEVLQGLVQDFARLFLRIAEKQAISFFADSIAGLFSSAGTYGSNVGSILGDMMFADGGRISGPGGPRSDGILAGLSNGEFVVNADATRKNLDLLTAINSGHIAAFADGGMAGSALTTSVISPSDIGSAAIVMNNTFNVNASGGTPDQNQDLAQKISKQIVPQFRQLVQSEIQNQMRAGGMFNRGYGGG